MLIDTCDHLTVTRGELDGSPIWTCTECADQFGPLGNTLDPAFVRDMRENMIPRLADSALGTLMIPDTNFDRDIVFALQVGSMVLMDKPILTMVLPGAHVSDKLRLVSEEVIECDPMTKEGQAKFLAALVRMDEAVHAEHAKIMARKNQSPEEDA